MPEMTVTFYVYCSCGEHMCNETTVDESKWRSNNIPSVVVNPCPRCMKKARDEGYDAGYSEAEARHE
jgi:hypothetical protein